MNNLSRIKVFACQRKINCCQIGEIEQKRQKTCPKMRFNAT